MNTIAYGGLIYRVADTDYLIGATDPVLTALQQRQNPDSERFDYNQLSINNGQNACTIFGMMGQISDLYNYKFTKEEFQEVWDLAVSKGADINKGWYFNSACDLVRNWWNAKYPDKALISFRINYADVSFLKVMESGYSPTGGYRGNSAYNDDANDGMLDGTSFTPSTYGHCIRVYQDFVNMVIDNYEGWKAYNRYKLRDLNELVKNGCYYENFYLYLPKKIMTPSELKRLEAKKIGIWNGDRENEPVTRGECAEMIMNFKSYLEKPKA